MKILGLIGKSLSHSFSKQYFTAKFEREGIRNIIYKNFEIEKIEDFPKVLKDNSNIIGLNITIPYKESVIPYLDDIDKLAQEVGAVNVIKIKKNRELIGYNTDVYGFSTSLKEMLSEGQERMKALILGSGGASKAIQISLQHLKIPYKIVSRVEKNEQYLTYQNLTKEIIQTHKLIINTTPLGTYPNIDDKPPIPYEYLSKNHVLHDLVYNPSETCFLKMGKKTGVKSKNGLEMLQRQAEKSWQIWIEES